MSRLIEEVKLRPSRKPWRHRTKAKPIKMENNVIVKVSTISKVNELPLVKESTLETMARTLANVPMA